jgi:hypothetical protein
MAVHLMHRSSTVFPPACWAPVLRREKEAMPIHHVNKETSMTTAFSRTDAQHTEGRIARTIEDQTAKLPSDTFLWIAVGCMATSATLQMMGNKHASLFVGQWAPTILIMGLYNKLVKQLGSDRTENAV